MKNKSSVWKLFILAAVAVLTVSGCLTTAAGTSSQSNTNEGNFGEHTRTPVKDFESVGLVFTETQLRTTANGNIEGQIFTYQALLKEAQTLGADAIINVVIDTKQIQTGSYSGAGTTTWYGSALAVKYTATLTETESVTVTAEDGVATTTTKTSVYFNDTSPAANTGSPAPAAGAQPPAQAGSVLSTATELLLPAVKAGLRK